MCLKNTIDTSREDLADAMKALGMTEGFDVGLEMSGAAPDGIGVIDMMALGAGSKPTRVLGEGPVSTSQTRPRRSTAMP